jgi:hypothetical protein
MGKSFDEAEFEHYMKCQDYFQRDGILIEDYEETFDVVNKAKHYNSFPGVEVIQIIEHLNFCRGSAVKYIARAGLKDKNKELEDLEKAQWYLNREIERIKDK